MGSYDKQDGLVFVGSNTTFISARNNKEQMQNWDKIKILKHNKQSKIDKLHLKAIINQREHIHGGLSCSHFISSLNVAVHLCLCYGKKHLLFTPRNLFDLCKKKGHYYLCKRF